MQFFRKNKLKNKIETETASTSPSLEAQKDIMERVQNIRRNIESIESGNDIHDDKFEAVLSGLFLARAELIKIDVLILAEAMNGQMGPRVLQVHKDQGEMIWKEINLLESRIQSNLFAMGIDYKQARVLWESAWKITESNYPRESSFIDVKKIPWAWITQESWNLGPPKNEELL